MVQSSGANDPQLLGHEATHVVQQSQMALKPDVNGTPINANPALEQNADDNGERVARHESVKVKGASVTGQPETGMDGANRPPVQRREDGIIQRYIEGRTTSDRNPKAAQKYLEKLGYTENVAKEVVKLATVTESGRKFRYSNLARIAKIMTTKGISANAAFVLNNAPPAPNRPVPNAPPPLPLRPVLGAPVGINNNNAIVNNNNNNNNQHHNAAANNNNVDANNNQLLNANNGNGASLNNVEDQYEAEEKLEELKNSKAKPAKNNNNNQKLNIEEKWDENDDEFNDDHNDAKEDISNNNNNSLPNAPLNNGQASVDFGAAQTNFNVKFSGPVQFPGKKAWLSPDEWMQHSQVQIRGLESEEKKEQAKDINKENSKIESTNLASSSPVSKQQNNLNQGSENIVYLKSVAYLLEQLGFKKHALEKYEIINITTNNGIERLLMLLQVLRTKFETLGLVSESENRDKAEAIYGVLDIINKDLGNYYSSNDLPQPRIYDLLEDIDEFMSKISSYAPNEDEEDYDLENIVHLKDEADILNQFDLKEYAIKVDITNRNSIKILKVLLRTLKEKFGQLGLVSESENKDKAKAIYGILYTIEKDLKKYYENNDPLQPSIKPIGYLLEDMYELMHSISSYLPNQVKKKYPDKNEFGNDEKADINNNNSPLDAPVSPLSNVQDPVDFGAAQSNQLGQPDNSPDLYDDYNNNKIDHRTLILPREWQYSNQFPKEEKETTAHVAEVMKSAELKAYLQHIPIKELAAINAYRESEFIDMNYDLREKTGNSNGVLMAASGLNRLPPVVGTVYRGVSLTFKECEEFGYFKVGEIRTEKAFMSTTIDKRFWMGETAFQIESKGGAKDLRAIAAGGKECEDELLFTPGTEFKVEGVTPLPEVMTSSNVGAIPSRPTVKKPVTVDYLKKRQAKAVVIYLKEIPSKDQDTMYKELGEKYGTININKATEMSKLMLAIGMSMYKRENIHPTTEGYLGDIFENFHVHVLSAIKQISRDPNLSDAVINKLKSGGVSDLEKLADPKSYVKTLLSRWKIHTDIVKKDISNIKEYRRRKEEKRLDKEIVRKKELKKEKRKLTLEKSSNPAGEILKFIKEDIGNGHESLPKTSILTVASFSKYVNIFRELKDDTLLGIIKECRPFYQKGTKYRPHDSMNAIAQKNVNLTKKHTAVLFRYIKKYWNLALG
ncbi:MAG: hypothetical protein AAFW84_27630 [Cyanobacteria bacterium J06635_15]